MKFIQFSNKLNINLLAVRIITLNKHLSQGIKGKASRPRTLLAHKCFRNNKMNEQKAKWDLTLTWPFSIPFVCSSHNTSQTLWPVVMKSRKKITLHKELPNYACSVIHGVHLSQTSKGWIYSGCLATALILRSFSSFVEDRTNPLYWILWCQRVVNITLAQQNMHGVPSAADSMLIKITKSKLKTIVGPTSPQ